MTGRATPSSLEFRAIIDEPIGSELTSIFQEYWPAYKRWMRKADDSQDDDYREQLTTHMPELIPIYNQLIASFEDDDPIAVARFLALYNPPRVVRGCSQIVLDSDDGPVLLRSYDHHPSLIDALVVKSTWLDHAVIAMSDCIWGALDGINEYGLAVSLAFGGRNVIGPGFAAPLITRYILETCSSVQEARLVLSRVPVYMAYTFLVVDASGNFVTAYTGPDTPTRFVERRASTNHQSIDDWPTYQRYTQSVERLNLLESMTNCTITLSEVLDAFLHPPLWRNDYAHASGTLYVAEYRPSDRSLTLHWPDRNEHFPLHNFAQRTLNIPVNSSTDKQCSETTRDSTTSKSIPNH